MNTSKLKPILYDTSYEINQISFIHKINGTLQVVSGLKDANASYVLARRCYSLIVNAL